MVGDTLGPVPMVTLMFCYLSSIWFLKSFLFLNQLKLCNQPHDELRLPLNSILGRLSISAKVGTAL